MFGRPPCSDRFPATRQTHGTRTCNTVNARALCGDRFQSDSEGCPPTPWRLPPQAEHHLDLSGWLEAVRQAARRAGWKVKAALRFWEDIYFRHTM